MLRHADHLQAFLSSSSEMTTAGVPAWAVTALGDCTVMVDRLFDLAAEATKHFEASTKGAFILIELPGWNVLDEDGDQLPVDLVHGITAWFLPGVLEGLESDTFDVILNALLIAIHGYEPPEDPRVGCYRWRVGSGALVPDPNFLIYGFNATITEDLVNPVPTT